MAPIARIAGGRVVDERRLPRAPRERLDPERARAREQVEHACVVHALAEDGEQRLAHAVGGRARVHARGAPGGGGPRRCRAITRIVREHVASMDLRALCLGFAGAEETYPVRGRDDVFKVPGEYLRLAQLAADPPRITLKCEPDIAVHLRADIRPSRPATTWTSAIGTPSSSTAACPTQLVREMVEDSYDLVVDVDAQAGTRRSGMAMTTILVTGATDGLGRAVARDLALARARRAVHGRDRDRAEAVAGRSARRARSSRTSRSLAR